MALSTARLRAVDLSRLVAHLRIFRLFMKGKFDAYVLWPLAQRVQNWIIDRCDARDFTVTDQIWSDRIITKNHLFSMWATK